VPYFFFKESFDLYAVSAREELVALPGASDGGIIPLLAAESTDPEPVVPLESMGLAELAELLWQELKNSAMTV